MIYVNLLTNGTREQKAKHLFQMIARKNKEYFEYKDLLQFYLISNRDDDLNESINSFLSLDSTDNSYLEEKEMANIVFCMIKKEVS